MSVESRWRAWLGVVACLAATACGRLNFDPFTNDASLDGATPVDGSTGLDMSMSDGGDTTDSGPNLDSGATTDLGPAVDGGPPTGGGGLVGSGTPTEQSLSEAQSGGSPYRTSSTSFVDVPNTGIEVAAGSADSILIVSAQLDSGAQLSGMEVQLTDNATELMRASPALGSSSEESFMWAEALDRRSMHSIRVRIRSTTGVQVSAHKVRVYAFSLAATADAYAARASLSDANATFSPVASLAHTPSGAGDYLVLASVVVAGATRASARVRDGAGDLWPSAAGGLHLSVATSGRQPFFLARRITTDGSDIAFTLEAAGAGFAMGNVIAIRSTAFEWFYVDESRPEVTLTNGNELGRVTVPAPGAATRELGLTSVVARTTGTNTFDLDFGFQASPSVLYTTTTNSDARSWTFGSVEKHTPDMHDYWYEARPTTSIAMRERALIVFGF